MKTVGQDNATIAQRGLRCSASYSCNLTTAVSSETEWRAAMRGGAMVEFAITLPLVLIMLAGMLDVGRAVTFYMMASRVAYEGGRYACVVRDLDQREGCFGDECSTPEGYNTAVLILRTRIEGLLDNYGYSNHKVTTTIGRQDYEDPSAPGVIKSFVFVDVTVAFPYVSLLGKFNVGEISATVRSPYLYPDKIV